MSALLEGLRLLHAEHVERDARGLRGRFGVDVWERYLSADADARGAFLARHGVPGERLAATGRALAAILQAEGIGGA